MRFLWYVEIKIPDPLAKQSRVQKGIKDEYRSIKLKKKKKNSQGCNIPKPIIIL